MPYRIEANLDDKTPDQCRRLHETVVYGKSDVKCPPHGLSEEEFQAGRRCRCLLVYADEVNGPVKIASGIEAEYRKPLGD